MKDEKLYLLGDTWRELVYSYLALCSLCFSRLSSSSHGSKSYEGMEYMLLRFLLG